MSESYLAMDTDLLKQDMETFRSQMAEFRQEMEAMREEAGQITTIWEGAASRSFVGQMAQDYNRMEEICKEMEQYLHCMEEAHKSYINCENQIADTIAALRI